LHRRHWNNSLSSLGFSEKSMTYFFKKLFLIIVLSGLSNVYAADTASADLTQLLNNVRTMRGGFVQLISDTKGKLLNQTSGRMALQRPGKFRWETIKPNEQLIVTNGKKIWIYDPDLEQVTIRYLSKEAGETPALLLSNTNDTLARDFRVQALPSNSTTRWFLLTPKDKGSVFASIKLAFEQQQIKQMQLQDHLGHITRIQFNHVVINSALSPSLFMFKPPANVDTIDETHK
jgi:outer membrane lipoprotein carrier protein